MNVLPTRAETEEPASMTSDGTSADVDEASLDTTASEVSILSRRQILVTCTVIVAYMVLIFIMPFGV